MKIMTLNTKTLLYDGNRKSIYQSANNDRIILSFKDYQQGSQHVESEYFKGHVHNCMSEKFFSMLNSCNLHTHFIKKINNRDQEVFNTSAFPFSMRITNIISRDEHLKFGLDSGSFLDKPLAEFIHGKEKNVIDIAYLSLFDWCNENDLAHIKEMSLRINDLMQAFLYQSDLKIADITLNYGLFTPQFTVQNNSTHNIMLIDDLGVFNIRFWDTKAECAYEIDENLIKKLLSYLSIELKIKDARASSHVSEQMSGDKDALRMNQSMDDMIVGNDEAFIV